MQMLLCPNCQKRTGFRRALGFGTFFVVLITFGLWLLIIPLYPARCMSCGLQRQEAIWTNLRGWWQSRTDRQKIVVGSLLAILIVAVLISTPTQNQQPTPIVQGDYGARHEAVPSAVVNNSRPSEDRELHINANLFGGNPVSDGRTYSVALIAAASEIPVGTQLFAQGRVASFGYAGTRSRPFAVIEDEQQPGRTLFCAMMADEGAEVVSLYHQGESVQVFGEYMGAFSLGGNPRMPTLSDCKVAGPTDRVARPAQAPMVSRPAPVADSSGVGVVANDNTPRPSPPLRDLPDPAEIKRVEQRLFGERAVEIGEYTTENTQYSGPLAVIEFCKPHACDQRGGMLTLNVSTDQASRGHAAGILYGESEVIVYLGDYGYKENLPTQFQSWMEKENWAERVARHYKNVSYVRQDDGTLPPK